MSVLLSLFGMSFVVGFSGAMMPGPVLTATVSESLKRGFKAGPLIILGHAIVEFLLLAALVLGLRRWLNEETQPLVLGVVGPVGGILMLLMGVQMVATARRAVREVLATESAAAPSSLSRGPVLAGILLSIAHPYWIIWWATIGLGFATRALEHGLLGLWAFYIGHILSDLAWYSAVSAAVASGRHIAPPAAYRWLIRVCGIMLAAIGLLFLVQGIRVWL